MASSLILQKERSKIKMLGLMRGGKKAVKKIV